jgi:outer membrane protein assembly factor BamB
MKLHHIHFRVCHTAILHFTLGAIASTLATTASADWPSFRNGGSSHHQASLPTDWSADNGIAWQHELDGYGQSSPIVHGNLVYTTSVVGPMCEDCVVECRDLATGLQRWVYRHPSRHGHPSNYMNARAAPTPTADHRGVFAFFETGDLVALDHDGKLLWSRDETKSTGKYDNSHGVGASLAQNDTHVFLNLEHGGPSFLTTIDKQSGATTWTAKRQSSKSWSSPVIANVAGDQQVILSSGGSVAGYRVVDGTLQWSIDGIQGNSVPSPTVSGNWLLIGARLAEFASDGDARSNCCLDLSKFVDGKPTVSWRAEKAICEYASPVVVDGLAYFLSKANVLHCLDVQTGEVIYRQRLGGDCWATPIVSQGKLYFFAKNGQCEVVQAGRDFEKLSSNSLWNPKDPPTPESYVESSGDAVSAHGHPGSGKDAAGGPGAHKPSSSAPSRPGGGMVARIKAGDKNGDGVLEGDEIPDMFRGMIGRIDTNGDGKLDGSEIDAMAKSFAERRKDAAANARDPIVYGVAASDGNIIVRTGTRLFAISG